MFLKNAIPLAIAASLSGQPSNGRALSPARITWPAAPVVLPMQDFGTRPVVALRINGRGPYRFILDSGASSTVLADDFASELSLPVSEGRRAGANDGGAVTLYRVREVGLGGLIIKDLIAPALPLGVLLKGENAPRGVMSASLFINGLVTFDYPDRTITIAKGELPRADARTVFQYSAERELPSVPVQIAGHEVWVDVDTGSAYGLSLQRRYLAELPLAGPPREIGTARTMSGAFPVSSAKVDGPIAVGEFTLHPDEVRFSDVRPGPGPAAANIGYEVLKDFIVTIDATNRRVKLRRN